MREGEEVLLRHSYFVLSGTCIGIIDKIEQEKKGLSDGNDFQESMLGSVLALFCVMPGTQLLATVMGI